MQLYFSSMLSSNSQRAQQFSDHEIQRAIRHHRRALSALQDRNTFEGIRDTTAGHLIERLQQDLRHLEEELERRGSFVAPEQVALA